MAIALLPLMEGETLGSNFGRYAEFMCLRSTENLRRTLFGYACAPGTRLPSAITHLAQQTMDYWNLAGDEIVNGYTEFRYATMMSSQSTREKLLGRMLTDPLKENPPLRILRYDGERAKNLRYCSECLAEWKRIGEPIYWKIDHQLVGAYYCIKHSCVLKSVAYGHAGTHGDLLVMALVKSSDESVIRDGDLSKKFAIEDVAKRSARQRAEGGVSKSVKKYRELLQDAGFVRATSLLRQDAVIAAWSDFFGKEYCHLTGMSAARISSWLDRLSGRAICGSPHPFMFIAAECFLEHHVSLPGSFLPAERCKLPAFSSELKVGAAVVEGVKCEGALHRNSDVLKFSGFLRRSGGWKLVCTCGISYRMLDSPRCDAGKLMPFSYGSRYQTRFRALIAKGVNAKSASRELHLSNSTAAKWAHREREGSDKTLPRREINGLRTEWRLLVKSISSERRISTAAESKPAVYKALLKNDHDWLIKFNSSHRSWRPQSSYKVREPTTDEIRMAWQELLVDEPPVRSTAVAILEKVGFWGDRDRNRPFAVLLAELTESRSAYLERVISWLAILASEHRLDSCDEAIRRAGLRLRSFTSEQRSRIREIDSLVVGLGE
ncbi:MAG: hypothetical protein EPN73_02365 [Paraburkholderia sp.]|uniref:TnsD family Tn7-like transposition protein n=1 Tax=Paraburkholderia sp. TaxID=1926495 RepID=UPI00120EB90C|nr:TnsD family Tn7-like transposition protein [Paraburkholderia sp.]TAL98773.1 MAG: hypothetical protein EPN73_02365 [Paraburkholderia sp.]